MVVSPDSEQLRGETEKTIDDSCIGRPSLTAFMRGENSGGAEFLAAIVDRNMLREVEASYVKNLTKLGS